MFRLLPKFVSSRPSSCCTYLQSSTPVPAHFQNSWSSHWSKNGYTHGCHLQFKEPQQIFVESPYISEGTKEVCSGLFAGSALAHESFFFIIQEVLCGGLMARLLLPGGVLGNKHEHPCRQQCFCPGHEHTLLLACSLACVLWGWATELGQYRAQQTHTWYLKAHVWTQILEAIPATVIRGFRGTPKWQDSVVASNENVVIIIHFILVIILETNLK